MWLQRRELSMSMMPRLVPRVAPIGALVPLRGQCDRFLVARSAKTLVCRKERLPAIRHLVVVDHDIAGTQHIVRRRRPAQLHIHDVAAKVGAIPGIAGSGRHLERIGVSVRSPVIDRHFNRVRCAVFEAYRYDSTSFYQAVLVGFP